MAITSGFDRAEALDMLAMCAIIELAPLKVQAPIPDPPPGWTSLFVSPVIPPFDNMWQLWKRNSDGAFAIAIRGTVYQPGSIVEDLLALMIEATGTITVEGVPFPYSFAADPLAGVHLGFVAATLLVAELPLIGILEQLQFNGVGAGSQVYVTGHSQGAAMATLLRSYLQYGAGMPQGVGYKTYVFAQPKPGNDHYAADFESRFSNVGLGFRVTNSLDWVPQVPFTIEILSDINVPNPLSVLTQPEQLIRIGSAMHVRAITTLVHDAGHLIVEREIDRVRPALQQLMVAKGKLAAATPSASIDLPVMLSFNYVNAATNFSLMGVPCKDKECSDAFFEHHAETYYKLLLAA